MICHKAIARLQSRRGIGKAGICGFRDDLDFERVEFVRRRRESQVGILVPSCHDNELDESLAE